MPENNSRLYVSIVVSENNSELQDQCYEHNARIIIDKNNNFIKILYSLNISSSVSYEFCPRAGR